MRNLIISIITLLLLTHSVYSSQFDELDKPPEGAHKGQMLLGAFVSFFPLRNSIGKIIDAEYDFVKKSTYSFNESDITKEFWIDHLTFGFGLMFEYMPIDYLGIKTKVKMTMLKQRTNFGSDFQSWNETLYSDYSFYLGPVLHLTTRKQWDIVLSPYAGYALGTFKATPIASKIIQWKDEDGNDRRGYSGGLEKKVNGFSAGSELTCNVYFSGGLFISIGFDWTLNILKFDKKFNIVNKQTGRVYFKDQNYSLLNTFSLILSAGYAFSN